MRQVRWFGRGRRPTCQERVPNRWRDYVYRQKWAEFIRSRSPRANRPLYSGFGTLMFLSTGVIRNLLEPCFWMWDAAISEMPDGERDGDGST